MDGSEAMEKKHFAIILGQVLQQLRAERGMSLLDVAKSARISEATICRYEHGSRITVPLWELTVKDVNKIVGKVRVPDLFTAYKLSVALGVTLDKLMDLCISLVMTAKEMGSNASGKA
jgi:transcriptional regulator with XRE-family HTH domain